MNRITISGPEILWDVLTANRNVLGAKRAGGEMSKGRNVHKPGVSVSASHRYYVRIYGVFSICVMDTMGLGYSRVASFFQCATMQTERIIF